MKNNYKVGDKVQIIKNIGASMYDKYIGDVCTIHQVHKADVELILSDWHFPSTWKFSEIELVKKVGRPKGSKNKVQTKSRENTSSFKLTKTTITENTYRVEEGIRYLEMTFSYPVVKPIKVDTNLPYKKTISDWDFYAKAISKIMQEVKYGI